MSDIVLIYSLDQEEYELFNEYQFLYPKRSIYYIIKELRNTVIISGMPLVVGSEFHVLVTCFDCVH